MTGYQRKYIVVHDTFATSSVAWLVCRTFSQHYCVVRQHKTMHEAKRDAAHMNTVYATHKASQASRKGITP